MKMKTVVTIKADANCPSHSRSDIAIRDLSLTIDEPEARGGTNQGATPTEVALAALTGCTNVIAHKCAVKLGINIGHLKITTACEFDRRGVTLTEEIDVPFTSISLNVTSDTAVAQADLDRLAIDVAKFCPLSKLFEQAGTEIVTSWSCA